MIQKIFKSNNTKTLSGKYVVEELIPFVGAPEIAEEYIMEMIKEGTLIQEGKKLTLNLPEEVPESAPEPEPETETIDNSKIKKNWLFLRNMEKENPNPKKFLIYVDYFIRKYGWNYYILNRRLRETCESLGYICIPEERALFQKEVLQK